MTDTIELRQQLVSLVPNLRAFAFSLSRDRDDSDDLVQETLIRAWEHRAQFQVGTNLKAWLFTILRNSFYNSKRKLKHHNEYLKEIDESKFTAQPSQEHYVEFTKVLDQLKTLPPEQREVLVLVVLEGMSYDQAAAVCGCPAGTIKSRLNRARLRLSDGARVS